MPRTSTKVLGDANSASSAAAKKRPGKTIEQIYQKKTQLEHILLRPDTYIGSTEMVKEKMWVVDGVSKKLVNRDISFVPGLYKIFDELLVNAADNKQRDASMNCMRVDIDPENNVCSVWNNGRGIPVVMHSEHGVYVPELIFGHLLTSSNYNDEEKKVTGGRNGYGAKLANIFSTEFVLETNDSESGQHFRQVFRNNMSEKEAPVISPLKSGGDFTCVSFKPDLRRFKMSVLDADIVALMTKRVYDMAGVTDKSVKVYLNGTRVPVRSFKEYVEMFTQDDDSDEPVPVVHEVVNDRWEVCVTASEWGFDQTSFVNSIWTYKGGSHVNHIVDQVVKAVTAAAKRKSKGLSVQPHQVKNHIRIFVNSLIENPAFNSQTKEYMITLPSHFGSTCDLSKKFLTAATKTGIVDGVLSWAKQKATNDLKKVGGGKKKTLRIEKLDDANFAATAKGPDCTLILTEGDSAKALAVSGLSVVGRDFYGVFPLKGKLLNVREASTAQIKANEEIQKIAEIVGLQIGKQYTSTKGLRYGHVMIMADQDHDGSHIKGLVINFMHHFWPELLRIPDFLCEFITPIVKCTKGKRSMSFFTVPEYHEWLKHNNDGKGWTIKYYKGLGTSTAAEAKEYFAQIDRHKIPFAVPGSRVDDLIDLAFSKKRADDRKEWLQAYELGTHIDYAVDEMKYEDFINKELILFSRADNVRSIPSAIDGLKPAQRKVLYACFKRNLKTEIKVAQLAGYVSEHAAYHHGEASLAATIVGMGQTFVGSNNINLLYPAGQFGTRLMGGKDAASARYIFTRLSNIARSIFRAEDDPLLTYEFEDGQKIEPEWYLPIIPMALVNGSEGIGTGWSSSVPCYNPRDLIANLRRRLNGQDMEKMVPWFRGFTGEVVEKDHQHFIVRGRAEELILSGSRADSEVEGVQAIHVSELPIRKWTQDYKHFLEGLVTGDTGKGGKGSKAKTSKKKKAADAEDDSSILVTEFKENHTDATVSFSIFLNANGRKVITDSKTLAKEFKLDTSISTTNMHLFDQEGKIAKFESPLQIIDDFYPLRLEYYGKRKAHLIDICNTEFTKLSNKVRFIMMVVNGELKVSNKRKAALIEELEQLDFAKVFKDRIVQPDVGSDETDSGSDGEGAMAAGAAKANGKGYDYLLSLPLWSLTHEKVEEIKRQLEETEARLNELRATSPESMWLADLDELDTALIEMDKETAADDAAERDARRLYAKSANGRSVGGASRRANKAAQKAASGAGSDWEDENMESDDSDFDFGAAKKKKSSKKGGKKGGKAAKEAAAGAAHGTIGQVLTAWSAAEQATLDRENARKAAKRAKASASMSLDASTASGDTNGSLSTISKPKKAATAPKAKASNAKAAGGKPPKAAKKPTKAVLAASDSEASESEVDEDEFLSCEEDEQMESLADRLAKRMEVTPKKQRSVPKIAAAKSTAAASIRPKATKATKAKAAATKGKGKPAAKAIIDLSSDSEMSDAASDFSGDESGSETASPIAPTRKLAPRPARRTAAKSFALGDDSASDLSLTDDDEASVHDLDAGGDESDFSFAGDSDFDEPKSKPSKAAATKAKTAKPSAKSTAAKATKTKKATATKAATTTAAPKRAAKRSKDAAREAADEMEETLARGETPSQALLDMMSPTKPMPAAKKKVVPKRTVAKSKAAASPMVSPTTQRTPPKKQKRAPAKKVVLSESSDESESDATVALSDHAPTAAARKPRRAAASRVKYALSESEQSEESVDEFEMSDDASDSDF